jgi:hypothetical protein
MTNPSIIQSEQNQEEFTHDSKQSITGVIILDENYRVILCNQFAYLLCFHQYSDQNSSTSTVANDRWQHNPLIEPDHIISFFDMDLSFQIIDLKNKIEQAFY